MNRCWTQRLRATGTEPDPRFTLANERTFLAWIRTALALLAAGVGLTALGDQLGGAGGLRKVVALLLVVLGAVAGAASFGRWRRTELALREGSPLPPPAVAPLLGYGVTILAVAALAIVLASR